MAVPSIFNNKEEQHNQNKFSDLPVATDLSINKSVNVKCYNNSCSSMTSSIDTLMNDSTAGKESVASSIDCIAETIQIKKIKNCSVEFIDHEIQESSFLQGKYTKARHNLK